MAMKPVYYLLNETIVSEDTARRGMEIINEDVITLENGLKLFTITYNMVLTEFARRNWNGRVYGEQIFMNALDNNPLFQHDLKNNGGVGSEYGHPSIASSKAGDQSALIRQMTIDPKLVCAMLKKYWKDGKLLKGTYTTVAGGYGDMLRDRILTGVPAMVSSRSVGGVDAKGNVLPSLQIITWDHVFRPSSQDARLIPGSLQVNEFNVPAGNTMSESALSYDFRNDPSFKDFLLSESVSKEQINTICDAFDIDAHSMVIDENSVRFTVINEDGVDTVIMPIRTLVGASMYELFK